MSRLIAKLLLAMLMLPTAAAIYVIGIAIGMYGRRGPFDEELTFLFTGMITLGYVACYWLMLWRGTVVWTPQRKSVTVGVTVAAVFVGGLVTFAIVSQRGAAPGFGIFLGTAIAMMSWLVMTVLVWRETDGERMARIRLMGRDTIVCIACGYNLTGLKRTLCPECGAEPTVAELLAGQPARQEAELTSK